MTDTTDTAALLAKRILHYADMAELTSEKSSEFGADLIRLTGETITTLLNQLEAQRQQADNSSTGWLNAIAERDEARSEIVTLKEKHAALRESMAAIHNTIRGSGGHISLSVLLGASEKAWRDSAPIENSVKEKSCDKCGGSGSYHCPQMLGTVECECGIVKDVE